MYSMYSSGCVEVVERLLEVDEVILAVGRLDHHVVDVGLQVPSQLLGEDLVDHSLVCGPCVLQAEGHNSVTVYAASSSE